MMNIINTATVDEQVGYSENEQPSLTVNKNILLPPHADGTSSCFTQFLYRKRDFASASVRFQQNRRLSLSLSK